MTEQRASRWEPSNREISRIINALHPDDGDGCPECGEAEPGEGLHGPCEECAKCLLRAVGPMIVARALREAAASFVVNVDDPHPSISGWLRARADSLSPDPKEGAA